MKSTAIDNIRLKLLAPYIGSLALIILGGLWSLNYYEKEEQVAFAETISQDIRNTFEHNIQDDVELIKGISFFVSRSEAIRQAWLSKDRAFLLDESLPVFQKIKADYRISHFYFHNLDGSNYLRVHSPSQYGDQIDRHTLERAIKTNSVSADIEFGTFGQFVLRVVIPWIINDELVGYIELGEEIDQVLEHTSIRHAHDFILAMDKNYIRQENLDETEFFLGKSAQLNKSENVFILHQTIDNISDTLFNIIDAGNGSGVHQYQRGEQDFIVSRIPIVGTDKMELASIFYLLDVSESAARRADLYGKIILTFFISGFTLMLFYIFYSGRIQNVLQSNISHLKREIRDRKEIQSALVESKDMLEGLVEERNYSLGESRKRYKTLFDQTADALLIIEGNVFVDCNQATLDMLRLDSKESLYNIPPSELSPEFQPDGRRSDEKADDMIRIAFEKGSHRFEWEHIRKNHEVFPVEVLLTSIPFEGTQLLHVVWRDITARKKAAAEIEHRAYYDQLTGLSNRRLLLDRLSQSLINTRRHDFFGAVLFIDLDRFKTINDSLGHSAGDELLIESARRIKSCISNEDTAARHGSDEFVVLLRHLGRHDKELATLKAERTASKILEVFKQPFVIQDQAVHVTISLGVAMFPFQDESVDDVLKHADTAMYSAKENGRNQISFYISHMHEKLIKRLELEKDLRNAIKSGSLGINYQPQIGSQGEIIAVEALSRWQHPEHGFVNPEEFISIAEDTGMIYELGDLVLHRSIKDISTLNREFKTAIKLAVNISPRQFRKRDFVDQIKTIVGKYQLEKDFLTLELTESIAVDNLNDAIEKIDELRHIGVRLSLDDFGTGYSSLSHLKRLPIDELKIDKSFVFDIEKDPQDALLVQTIIKIAHQFRLDVVAEGVETQSQLDFLKEEGCDIYQGYFYSKPLKLEQLKVFVA